MIAFPNVSGPHTPAMSDSTATDSRPAECAPTDPKTARPTTAELEDLGDEIARLSALLHAAACCLLGPIGDVPAVEYEEAYYQSQTGSTEEIGLRENSLR
jgi:hypothetical protein